jgi:hypothetical protein
MLNVTLPTDIVTPRQAQRTIAPSRSLALDCQPTAATNDAAIQTFPHLRVERCHQRNASDVRHSPAAVNDASSLPFVSPRAALRPEPISDGPERGASAPTPAQVALVHGGRVPYGDHTLASFVPELPDLVGIPPLHNDTHSFPTA